MLSFAICLLVLLQLLPLEVVTRVQNPPPIRQVDHVIIFAENPNPIVAFLRDTLGLAEAWPISTFGTFRSGGVSLGNLNVEVLQVPVGRASNQLPARLGGIAFEPEPLIEAVAALKQGSIPVGQPSSAGPYALPPDDSVAWTTAALPSLSSPALTVFLCEYSRLDIRAFRARMVASLSERQHARLGMCGAYELVVGTGGDSSYLAAWARLIEPHHSGQPLMLKFRNGPRVVVDPNLPRGLRRLVISVSSLSRAAEYLADKGISSRRTAGEIEIARDRAYGLDIRLTEARS
jgi:hypothetical protein